MRIQTLYRPEYPSNSTSPGPFRSGTRRAGRFLAAMTEPGDVEAMASPDREHEAQHLADRANTEWDLLEKVLTSFLVTAFQGVANDMELDAVNAEVYYRALADDLCESFGHEMKSLALERVTSRLTAQEDTGRAGREIGRAKPSIATRGALGAASIRGFSASRLRTRIPSHRTPQWSSGAGPCLLNSATQEAEEPLAPEARSLVAQNYDLVLRLAAAARRRSGLAESVVDELEDVALKALTRAARNYDPADFRGASFNTYLYSQVTPDLAKACRKLSRRRGQVVDDGEVEDLPYAGRGVGADVEDKDLKKLLEREIKRLPPRQAEVVNLHIGLGDQPRMSLKQIAQQMGMNDASVRRLFGFGLRRLRQALAGQGVEEFMSRLVATREFDAHDRPVMRLAGNWYDVGESRRVGPCAA